MENVGKTLLHRYFPYSKGAWPELAICGIPKPLPSKKPDSDRRKEAGGGSPQKGQSDTIKKLTCYTLVRVK